MYQIVQVLNNNVAIVKDKEEQAIAMGKGLVFQKKKGDSISKEAVKNLFVLKNNESKENFSILLKDIPMDFITTAYEIIENAIHQYNYPVQEYIYVTLTDHIFWNYKRIINNTYQNSLLPDIKQRYPIEYQLAKDGLQIIKKNLQIEFPRDELKNISLHFINAKGQEDKEIGNYEQQYLNKKQLLEQIQIELQKRNIMRTASNQNFYDRMMIHLQYMLEQQSKNENDPFAKKMASELRTNYPNAYQIAENIYKIINRYDGYQLNVNEKVYLTIHIQRLL
ncbi:PRD domain-containing protein [Melissococcus plutonius]|uniref:Beta-glucoside bgl operon antiterminator, BglG family n=1 Tax=Melissococcus plutonius TaxID=33970 RepID=A0A2Z5Y4Q8_9ENTE|nr:PRD domain-containing protein [Melissococcus plutonius]BAL62893.1 transcription antiterminator [Melissococcus plutonius DAT561]MCV2499560.1 PRD domain-containing protein [Melissococcus plutonius]MCV2501843.1 PRD domain-containing protein [Melissococcus plutonius]MCV2505846.1 PRD domain-containing protein [Melissococcus plutonius]MCV2508124.1 PRD domain-containing protein [Melissococcus plutonius]